jgi:hypothetical protein
MRDRRADRATKTTGVLGARRDVRRYGFCAEIQARDDHLAQCQTQLPFS